MGPDLFSMSICISNLFFWTDPDPRIQTLFRVSFGSFDFLPGFDRKIDNLCVSFMFWTFRMVWYAIKRMRCKSGSVEPDRHVHLRPGTVKILANMARHLNYGSGPAIGPTFCAGPVRDLNFVLPSA
jgi:hypothetical protein